MKSMLPLLYHECIKQKWLLSLSLWLCVAVGIMVYLLMTQSQLATNFSLTMNYSGDFNMESLGKGLSPESLAISAIGMWSLSLSFLYLAKTLRLTKSYDGGYKRPIELHLVKLLFAFVIIPFSCIPLLWIMHYLLWQLADLLGNWQAISVFHQTVYLSAHYVERILLAGLVTVPAGLLVLCVSQRSTAPLLLLLILAYAIKWLSPMLVGTSWFSQYVEVVLDAPSNVLDGASIGHELSQFGFAYGVVYLGMGIIAAYVSVQRLRNVVRPEISFK